MNVPPSERWPSSERWREERFDKKETWYTSLVYRLPLDMMLNDFVLREQVDLKKGKSEFCTIALHPTIISI